MPLKFTPAVLWHVAIIAVLGGMQIILPAFVAMTPAQSKAVESYTAMLMTLAGASGTMLVDPKKEEKP